MDLRENSWDEITFIAERKGGWPDQRVKELEGKLKDCVVGEMDVLYSDCLES